MHGTVEMLLTITQFAQVNGRKEKLVPIYALNNERKTKNSSMQELFRIRTIKVLRGNFAAVDLCEEPCHNGLSEKEKHGGKGKQRTERRAAEEQGDFASGSAQNALSAAALSVALSFRQRFA